MQTHWTDASVDPIARLAFGAYMTHGMKRPVVLSLKNRHESIDAEIEIMTRALLRCADYTVVMTDLQHLPNIIEKWNYHVIRQFKETLELKRATVEYCPPEHRPYLYHSCHRAAIGRLRMERRR